MPLVECPSSHCKVNKAKLQELAEHVPKGHIPHALAVHFRGEVTRKVRKFHEDNPDKSPTCMMDGIWWSLLGAAVPALLAGQAIRAGP
ncbi:DNA replication licensing factor MCM7 [Carex littledalei]|uniref:DNA replication licensing factor MCM7 n=1 Tax=Carex littledalei TaxID=544730 RepID=A0A833VR55_9POAL|nr:DNA replication licensing factor MCM7 [Carex littledalei]